MMKYSNNNLALKFITLRLMENNRDSYKPLTLQNLQLPSFPICKAISGMLTAARLIIS